MSGWQEKRSGRGADDFFVERAKSRREAIERRLTEGFQCFGETVGGRWRSPFTEPGLRSESNHVLRRIVQLTPKAKRLLGGRSKDLVSTGDSKLLALDEPWIALNAEFRGVFRVDLDFTFPSWAALRYEIEQLPLPCLPHILVGLELPDGSVERPHALYILPYGSATWFALDDSRCRKDIVALWRGVHAGITKALLPLGADPGALSNPMRIKNPLSPFWTYKAWNETDFPDLSSWSGWVDTRTSRSAMIREAAVELSGLPRKASNILFTTFQQWVFEALREWHREKDPAYVSAILRRDRDLLAQRLFEEFVGRVSATAERPKQAQAILYRVAVYAADHWDPSQAKTRIAKDRGVCSEHVSGLTALSARQAVGARHTATVKVGHTVARIREALEILRCEGTEVTQSAVARHLGIDRTTVCRNWKKATGP